MTVDYIQFSASWNDGNRHLQKPEPTTGQKAWDAASRIIFYGPHQIFDRLKPISDMTVLNAAGKCSCFIRHYNKIWEAKWLNPTSNFARFFTPISLDITTPDDVFISAILYKSQLSESIDIPTIFTFNPNGGIKTTGCADWLMEQSIRHGIPVNVVIFDYRCTGGSGQGHLSAAGLTLDGDSIYQCLRYLGISDKNIKIFGVSLGGAVSAQVKALHPLAGSYVNANSFASIEQLVESSVIFDGVTDFVKEQFRPKFWEGLLMPILLLIDLIEYVVKSILKCFMQCAEWTDLNTVKVLPKLGERKLFVYAPQDEIMTGAGVHDVADVDSLRLRPKPQYRGMPIHHCTPFAQCNDEHGNDASARIFNFLIN